MHRKTILLLAMICFSAVLAACPSSTSKQSAATEQSVVMPASWPLANLTVPPGSTRNPAGMHSRTTLSYTVEKMDVNRGEGFLYAVGFESDMDFSEVREHVESCLDMSEYAIADEDVSDAMKHVYWQSSDDRFSVMLLYSDSWQIKDPKARLGIGQVAGYSLEIIEYRK